MKETVLQLFICALAFALSFAATTPSVFAQSQALNGQIEGTISDQNARVIPGAAITATNIESGATRTAITNENGIYRFPLLPLGNYRITAEVAGFKRSIRDGITLEVGQTVTVDIKLEVGDINLEIKVSADNSIADTGKTDLSRVINNRDVQNLPIPQRNPYNLGRLQTNVSGRPLRVFNNANLNVNGYLQRVDYLFDGNWSNLADRPGVRLLFVSETYVNEVQIVTNGFAAEFGNTPGMIMNIVTPSGTNDLRGSVGFRFARSPLYARPFFYDSPEDLPPSDFNNLTATVGGAIIRDRWHFYGGFELFRKDENTTNESLPRIRPEHKAQLIAAGLRPEIFVSSAPFKTIRDLYIFRTDAQLNKNNRLTARFNRSPHLAYLILSTGRLDTLERSQNNKNEDYSIGVQLVSYTSEVLNELRAQYAWRILRFDRNELSGLAPAVTITGVANFGSTLDSYAINPLERTTQIQDNLTRTRGTHVFKFGGSFIRIDDFKRLPISSIYTFPTIDAYIAARNGSNPRSYTSYNETFGNPETGYKATYLNFFAQDDWKLTRRLKINFGLRYDLYLIPKADETAPSPFSQAFNADKNNLAPRLGIAYALREGKRPTVIRFGAGIYYETPWLTYYERALRNNGNPRFFTVRFTPDLLCSPVFPNIFSGNLPSCAAFERDIDAISPDFVNMYALHTNFQIEQALTENLSISAGFVHSEGRHLPVYRQINCLPTGATLADGRPLFGTSNEPCRDRIFPQFRNIQMVESVGNLRYDALALQLTRRFSGGLQFSASYTFSKATDDAPDGSLESLNLSDASNRALDRSVSSGDQRHTFVMSLLFRPQFNFANKTARLLFNNNQFGIIANANSGERFNIISTIDLNRDGFRFDRPVGIPRNAGKTPPQYNVDLRYLRRFYFSERYQLEVFGEFQNLFNINSITGFSDVTVSNVNSQTGELIGALPDFRARNQSIAQESRQLQLGFKFIF